MQIRFYQPEDEAAVAHITKAAWHGVSIAQMREQRFGVLGGCGWQDHKVRGVVGKCNRTPHQALVAVVNEQVVGYATFSITHNGDVGVVGDNAVDPAWQGRGIGTALITRVVELLEAAGVKMLEVSTFVHDAPARRVYERLGFTEVARSVHYFRPPSKEK